jgi:hypothetical protein
MNYSSIVNLVYVLLIILFFTYGYIIYTFAITKKETLAPRLPNLTNISILFDTTPIEEYNVNGQETTTIPLTNFGGITGETHEIKIEFFSNYQLFRQSIIRRRLERVR